MAVDAQLRSQIAAAVAAGKPIDVVVYLRSPVGVSSMSSQAAADLAKRVLSRTENSAGEGPDHVTIFGNLNAFAVGASPDFVLQLADQPEVLTVKPSVLPESFAFEPRKTPTAKGPGKSRRKVR